MGLITKTKVTTPSFAEQSGKIKEQFKVAHENASNLHSQMEQEIKKETETFMDNISKLI